MAPHTKRWALLIGIDFYFGAAERDSKTRSVKFHHLSGCVRDVEEVEKYLKGIGVCEDNITKLTASRGESGPKEDPTMLPTHGNIISEFNRITNNASPGDLVYIHYSGHGIRRNTLESALTEGGDNFSGTALAPVDAMIGGAYLTGYHLGDMIRRMVEDKNLRVTLILDSCFSGRGLRNTATFAVRTSPDYFDDSILPNDVEADNAVAAITGSDSKFRNAAVRPCWLSNPTGCTILTACEFSQTAGEDTFGDTKVKHGVLTFWMLDILRQCQVKSTPSHSRVKDHVNVKIRNMRPRLMQSPVLHGDGDYAFFGKELVIERPVCHILSKDGDYLDLDVGRAQRAAEGAIYDIYSGDWDIDSPDVPPLQAHIIELDEISDFRSTAQIFTHDPAHKDMVIKQGCCAILRTWALGSKTYVRLHLPDRPDLEYLRDMLKMHIEKTPELYLHSNTSPEPAFTVSVNQHNNFEVHENGRRLPRLPKIQLGGIEQQIERLAYILRHLARFREIEKLQNDEIENPLKSEWFLFRLETESGRLTRDPSGTYQVMDGQPLIVSFKLLKECGLESVYVTFFNLNPSWGIHKLYPGPGQSVHKTAENRLERFRIRMSIPDKSSAEDPHDIYDTIRVFVYAGENPPSWDELALPNLPVEDALIPLDFRVDAIMSDVQTLACPARQAEASRERSAIETDRWGVLDIKIHTTPRH
jgi:hypothetical protein